MSKKYSELEFTDGFMFAKIMYNYPDLCKELLELILQRPIERIEYTDYERTIEMDPNAKGVRLDVYTKDEKQNVYDIEMQVRDEADLPRRSRYYHSMIDLDLLEKGQEYSQLCQAYVIFICKKKPAEMFNKPVYTFCYQSLEDHTLLEDGTWTILLNADCDASGLSEEMQHFLSFIRSGQVEPDEQGLTSRLDIAVIKAKQNLQWRKDYMTYEQEMKYQFNLGRKEGHTEGLAEGRAEERINTEKERKRADAAEKRADAAEQEVARLKALLEQK